MLRPCLPLLLLAASCVTPSSATQRDAIGLVLDDWHAAAAAADGERYFGHFAQDAVFHGTDASERWNVAEFQAYAEPHFSQGRGWTYLPRDRHVSLNDRRTIAWFDERLDNEKYGELRGTGVLRREGGQWKIVHYNMSFPVPNEATTEVVQRIRAVMRESSAVR